ncbi:unnamed protein product, partial [Iphiclides podalirius]
MLDTRIIFFSLSLWISYVIGDGANFLNNNALQAQPQEKDVCYSTLYKLYCGIKCGTKLGLCIEKYCYCVYAVQASKRTDDPQTIYLARPEKPFDESDLSLDMPQQFGENAVQRVPVESAPREIDEAINYSHRPTLRHHIAHFCPNLDIARTCIRTCMKEGKPAFCGKDHVCYCGHKYNSRDETSNQNVAETYGQFRDLYEKYFGTHNYADVEKKIQ